MEPKFTINNPPTLDNKPIHADGIGRRSFISRTTAIIVGALLAKEINPEAKGIEGVSRLSYALEQDKSIILTKIKEVGYEQSLESLGLWLDQAEEWTKGGDSKRKRVLLEIAKIEFYKAWFSFYKDTDREQEFRESLEEVMDSLYMMTDQENLTEMRDLIKNNNELK